MPAREARRTNVEDLLSARAVAATPNRRRAAHWTLSDLEAAAERNAGGGSPVCQIRPARKLARRGAHCDISSTRFGALVNEAELKDCRQPSNSAAVARSPERPSVCRREVPHVDPEREANPECNGTEEAKSTPLFEFSLEFSDGWVEAFDAKMEQVMRKLEAADISQADVADCCLTITDATGSTITLGVEELEKAGLPRGELFSSSGLPIQAHFPLRVRFGRAEELITSNTSKPALITPGILRRQFLVNLLQKPIQLGGPVSLARVEELLHLLLDHEAGAQLPAIKFVPVVDGIRCETGQSSQSPCDSQ